MTTPADPTSNGSTPRPAGAGAVSPYPSFAAMREVHSELLRRRREAGLGATALATPRRTDGAAAALIADAAEFIRRGQASGAILDMEDERTAAQSLLTYWANILQRLGHEIDDATLAEFDPSLAPELPDEACPYVGLDTFRESDRGRFFGRDSAVDELVARLESERLLVMTGPSGSGKSSLVCAGLIPALREGAAPGSEDWRIIEPMMPGPEPFAALARTLRPGAPRHELRDIARELRARPEALPELLGPADGPPAVLVVDQFEELFTLVEAEAERAAFIAALLAAVDAPAPAHRILLTMRSDFETFAAATALGGRLERARAPVLPLSAAELRQAIEAPAQAVGLKFEPGVVDQLVQDIVGEPAGLPLLQFTLLKLWDERERNRITLAAYDRVGGGRQALARSADDFYDQLIPEDQVTVRRLLLRIVRPGEGLEVTSSRVRMDSLYALGEDPGRVERALQKLVDERLLRLTPGDEDSPPQVEVAHEALVRNWPRLVAWLEDEKVALATRRRLELRAEEWLRLGAGRDGLLDSAQLREAEHWVASPEATYLGYSPTLARLIIASREALREAEAEREAARQRELEQAKALAAEQQARAEAQAARAAAERRGRNVSRALSIMLAILAVGALMLFLRAQDLARTAQSLAVSEGLQRATAEVAATANASLARTSEVLAQAAVGQSQTEQALRATAETAGTAEAMRAAELARAQRSARAGELAAHAQAALDAAPQRSLLLAVESINATEDPEDVALATLYAAVARSDGEGLGGHPGPIYDAALSANGALAATAGDDGARLWDAAAPAPAALGPALADLGEPARLVALSPDGRWLAVAGPSRALLYPIAEGQAGQPFEALSGAEVTVMGISPAGQGGSWLVMGDATGRVLGRQLDGDRPGSLVSLSAPDEARGRVLALAFTPDGGLAITGGADRVARLWDLRPSRVGRRGVGFTAPRAAPISAIAASADGGWAAIGSTDGSIHIWRLTASGFGGGPWVKTGHQGAITTLAFSPNGAWLISGSADRNARLWRASGFSTTGADGIVLTGHTRRIVSARFSADSTLAVTGGEDQDLLVWRLADPAAPAVRLHGHDGAVTAVLAVGGRLLSAGADGQLRRWPLPPLPADERAAAIAALPLDEVMELACTIAGRELTAEELERYFPGAGERPPTCGR